MRSIPPDISRQIRQPETRPPWLAMVLIMAAVVLVPAISRAITLPTIQIGLEEAKDPKQVSVLIEILLLFTILSVAPAILLMTTCFIRIVVTFSFLRHAMGTQQMPPNQVMIGLAIFLTFFIMTPVFTQMNKTAIQPYLAEEINAEQALVESVKPLRGFMFSQTREKDLALFMSIAKMEKPQNKDDVPISTLIPAFMISELKTAFQIGFILFMPFLVIDMVVASILLSMGMMMLPPIMVSLPFKLLLFVLVDGWYLIVGSLVKSFGV
ncbi:MAG: flagellar type III secretion system pore protein FliP [Proteobacteria bacterium]|nr:flagellar type III secretion system pore protein FliP [Pseudomonadota bacterium]MBU1716223.1 flagellar type III secretion system pore protein FliP [Pseudomonadota bacterium]